MSARKPTNRPSVEPSKDCRKTTRRDGLVRLKESVNAACVLFFAKRGLGNKWRWR
jgi:hypothetical protein